MFTRQENRHKGETTVLTTGGVKATWGFVLSTHHQLLRAAQYLRSTYFNPAVGWDTYQEWLAFAILEANAALLIGDGGLKTMSAGYVSVDPELDLSWIPEPGRAKRMELEMKALRIKQAAALAVPIERTDLWLTFTGLPPVA